MVQGTELSEYIMHPKAQLRRFGRTTFEATMTEHQIRGLYTASLDPKGTEERKAIKKRMTFSVVSQTISSNDYSSKKSQKRSTVEEYNERGEITCRPSSKTDVRVNSYFSAKGRIPR